MRRIAKNIISYMMVATMMVNMSPTVTTNAGAGVILISTQIGINGWQIKEDYDEQNNPIFTFRTIGYAPKIGEEIVANGQIFTIERTGIIYTLDPDASGKTSNMKLDDSYTLLDVETRTGSGMEEYYEGIFKAELDIEGQISTHNLTYGYLSTEAAYADRYSTVYDRDENNNRIPLGTGYVRTMKDMGQLITNTIHMRSFVLTTTGEIIYSSEVEHCSVAEIAYQLYLNGKMPSAQGHEYIYENYLRGDILKAKYDEDNTYPYYWTNANKVEYGWSDIVKPSKP